MKKIALGVLFCIIFCSAFGSDSWLADKGRFFKNMQSAARIIIDKGIGGKKMQDLWEEMRNICKHGEDACRDENEVVARLFYDAIACKGKIGAELKQRAQMLGAWRWEVDNARSMLESEFIDMCRYCVVKDEGDVMKYVKSIADMYETGVAKLAEGKIAEVVRIIAGFRVLWHDMCECKDNSALGVELG